MPRRKIPQIVKTSEDVLREIMACPAPSLLKTDRLTEFLPFLVKKRRLGSSWSDLAAALTDRFCRYSLLEVRAAVEPHVDDPTYDADALIEKRLASAQIPAPPATPGAAPGRPRKAAA